MENKIQDGFEADQEFPTARRENEVHFTQEQAELYKTIIGRKWIVASLPNAIELSQLQQEAIEWFLTVS
jgi:hypothetical protein